MIISAPKPIPIPPWAGPAGAIAGAGIGGYWLGGKLYPFVAGALGDAIDNVCEAVSDKEKSCRALYDNQIQYCKGIPNMRTRQRCFEAAAATYESCMSED